MERKKIVHIGLLAVLIGGTLFAWYNSFKDLGIIKSTSGSCAAGAATMLGMPICVLGAIFFTIALGLATAMYFMD